MSVRPKHTGNRPEKPRGLPARSPKARAERGRDVVEAYEMILAGKTTAQIAGELNCSIGHAHSLGVDARKLIPQWRAEEVRAEVHARQLGVINSHWGLRTDPESAKVIQGSDKIILSTLPARTELTGKDGGPLLTAPIDLTKLTDAQIDALCRGDLSVLASPGGDGAPEAAAEPPGEPVGD